MIKYVILILCVFAVIFFASAYYSLILKRGASLYGPVIVTGMRRMYKKFLDTDEKISGTTRKIMTEKEKQKLDEEYRYKSANLSNPDTYKTVSTRMVGMLIAVFAINFKSFYGKILIAFFVMELVFEVVDLIVSKFSREKKQKLKSYEELKMWDRVFYGFIPQAIISVLLVIAIFL